MILRPHRLQNRALPKAGPLVLPKAGQMGMAMARLCKWIQHHLVLPKAGQVTRQILELPKAGRVMQDRRTLRPLKPHMPRAKDDGQRLLLDQEGRLAQAEHQLELTQDQQLRELPKAALRARFP